MLWGHTGSCIWVGLATTYHTIVALLAEALPIRLFLPLKYTIVKRRCHTRNFDADQDNPVVALLTSDGFDELVKHLSIILPLPVGVQRAAECLRM